MARTIFNDSWKLIIGAVDRGADLRTLPKGKVPMKAVMSGDCANLVLGT